MEENLSVTKSATSGIVLQTPILLGSLSFGILSFLLPISGKRLGANALEIGGLFSVFALTTLVIRPVVGWALDRFGRKLFFVAGLACYALTMLLFALTRDLTLLYAARFTQGLGSALLWISAYTVATELSGMGGRGAAVGRVDAAAARGGLIGALIGFFVFTQVPFDTAWSSLFLGFAAAALVGAGLAWQRVPETRVAATSHASASSTVSPRLFKLMVIVFVTALSTALLSPLLLIFLQDQFSANIVTLATAFIPAALVYSFLPAYTGRLSDRFGRAPLMALGLALAGIVSFLFPSLPSVLLLTAVWVLEAIGFSIATPAEEALVADLTGNDVRGTAYGIYTLAASLGATMGPLVGGWLYDTASHAMPFYVNGITLLVCAILVFVLIGRTAPGALKALG